MRMRQSVASSGSLGKVQGLISFFLYSSLRFADARMLPVCYSLARRGPFEKLCCDLEWKRGLGLVGENIGTEDSG
jgi:hypothetical protein